MSKLADGSYAFRENLVRAGGRTCIPDSDPDAFGRAIKEVLRLIKTEIKINADLHVAD